MELGPSGRTIDHATAAAPAAMVTAPVERSEPRGHRQRSPNSAALTQLIPLNSGFAGLWAASHECSGLVTGRTFPPIFVYQTAYDKDL
jgi:hypothetical protein